MRFTVTPWTYRDVLHSPEDIHNAFKQLHYEFEQYLKLIKKKKYKSSRYMVNKLKKQLTNYYSYIGPTLTEKQLNNAFKSIEDLIK